MEMNWWAWTKYIFSPIHWVQCKSERHCEACITGKEDRCCYCKTLLKGKE